MAHAGASAGAGTANGGVAARLSQRLKARAYGLGFDLVGITTLGAPATRAAFDAWIAAGNHGEMAYLANAGATLRHDTRRPHPGATHAIVLATQYGGRTPSGPVARYARGDDYHELLRERTRSLQQWLEQELGCPVNARPYVDSGPILERDLAQRAGLGWFGKNTMLINPAQGSFFFLSSLFVELPFHVAISSDDPFQADRCGSCTRCLDACPTHALTAPRVLDATRCVSYLTIELRTAIPEPLRRGMGGLLYGCDICNDVCPWNVRFSQPATMPEFSPRALFEGTESVEGTRALARSICMMDAADYAAAFRGSAMKRAKLWMLQRNACVVLGNIGTIEDVAVLEAMTAHEHAVVREHATWALTRVQANHAA